MDKISIVVSCYNEEEVLKIFYNEVTKELKMIPDTSYEIIFIDDGSKDNTLRVIKELRASDDNIRYISFSRNFGKESAMYAGLEATTGDYVAVIDADLQDPPSLLKQMYDSIKTGECDCVGTRRITRKNEPFIRSVCSKIFYKIINKMSKTEMVDGARDFRLMSRQMTNAILTVKEYNRYTKGIFSWVGFKTKWIEYENVERAAGKTKWSFFGLFKYAMEGIIAFSTTPLAIAMFLGLIFCVVAFFMIIVIIVKTLAFGETVTGYPSTICIILFLSGIQLFCTGIIGEYIAKTYLEVKGRPIYIIKETEKE